MVVSPIGLPVFSLSAATNSSARDSSASAILSSARWRSDGVVRPHVSKAVGRGAVGGVQVGGAGDRRGRVGLPGGRVDHLAGGPVGGIGELPVDEVAQHPQFRAHVLPLSGRAANLVVRRGWLMAPSIPCAPASSARVSGAVGRRHPRRANISVDPRAAPSGDDRSVMAKPTGRSGTMSRPPHVPGGRPWPTKPVREDSQRRQPAESRPEGQVPVTPRRQVGVRRRAGTEEAGRPGTQCAPGRTRRRGRRHVQPQGHQDVPAQVRLREGTPGPAVAATSRSARQRSGTDR